MKKFLFLGIVALLAMGTTTVLSCSTTGSDEKPSIDDTKVKDGADTGVEADVDAGYNPDAGIATMDDRSAVALLTSDDSFRPGKKVQRLTILDFNATWCGPCKQFAPAFEQGAEQYGQQADFYSVDVDRNPLTAAAFHVQSIPTVIFLYPDGTSKTYVGTGDLLPADKFLTLVKEAL